MKPAKVSFVIPCYNLAVYIGECIESILNQTYSDWELLVLDDCSPDNTSERVKQYRDRRIRYIRNEENLGHLRNYNKGIAAATGEYVWLISADDCLAERAALERYVRLMTEHPRVAYIFCPAVRLGPDGIKGPVLEWTRPFPRDQILSGRQFLSVLALGNCVASPSGLVRRIWYERAGLFPLDLPHAGDWFLWCNFAFQGDVGYFAEPMVCYRVHHAAMSAQMQRPTIRADQSKVRWRVKSMAERAGFVEVAGVCAEQLAKQYGTDFAQSAATDPETVARSVNSILAQNIESEREQTAMRCVVFQRIADELVESGHRRVASMFYRKCFTNDLKQWECLVKFGLLAAGKPGSVLRRQLSKLREPSS